MGKSSWTEWDAVRLGYRPGMDGIRALGVLGVMAAHGHTRFAGAGVDVFFVLSGFLITSLLIEEWLDTGAIHLRAFYGRRARRILPALFVAIALVGIIYAVLPSINHGWSFGATALAVTFYAGNWAIAVVGSGLHNPLGLLDPTWSLAVEEQFYLLWPIILIVFLRRHVTPKRLILVLLGVAVASAGWRAFLFFVPDSRNPWGPHHFSTFYRSDARLDGLALGCAVGIALATRGGRELLAQLAGPRTAAAGALAFLVLVAWETNLVDSRMYAGGWALVNIAGAILIVHTVIASKSFVSRALSTKGLVWLGKRSYGAYLFHLPIFTVLNHARVPLPFYPLFALRVAVTFALAALSYRWIEAYFLRGKKYPSARQSREPVGDDAAVDAQPAPAAAV